MSKTTLLGPGGQYWIRHGHTLGHFNVGTGCKYWITEVIELDSIVLDMFYCTWSISIVATTPPLHHYFKGSGGTTITTTSPTVVDGDLEVLKQKGHILSFTNIKGHPPRSMLQSVFFIALHVVYWPLHSYFIDVITPYLYWVFYWYLIHWH